MKVLAERSNAIFLWGPPTIVLSFIYLYVSWNFISGTTLINNYVQSFVMILFLSTTYNLIHRLFMPSVIIEYDKAGIYVYNKRGAEPIIIRYENLLSSRDFAAIDVSDEVLDIADNTYDSLRPPLITGCCKGNNVTGTLRIELSNQFITLHGIKNVGKVSGELDRLVRNYKKERCEFYEERIMKQKDKTEV